MTADSGSALTLAEIDERLNAYGIRQIDDPVDENAKQISNPDDWEFSSETCNYVSTMITNWFDRSHVPGGVERHAVACGQRKVFGIDALGGCSSGGNEVGHAVPVDPSSLDIADTRGLDLSERGQQWGQLGQHLGVRGQRHDGGH